MRADPACDLDDLIGAAPQRVRSWMRRKQELADGTVDRQLLVHPDTLSELIGAERARCPDSSIRLGRKSQSTWEILEAGALRTWSARTYQQIAEGRDYFGDFVPFGDFDLLFGAAKLNLKIREVPIRYRNREYGEIKISRFKHGILLLRMSMLGFRRFKLRRQSKG